MNLNSTDLLALADALQDALNQAAAATDPVKKDSLFRRAASLGKIFRELLPEIIK